MAVNENIMVRLTANISDYSAKMQAASAQTQQLAETVVKPTNRIKQFETAATKTGMAVGAMSLAFGVSAVQHFADFDEAMSEVSANTGATGRELESLRDAALEAGKSTVYNATESANAINELAKAGMSTSDVLNGGLNGALSLAASDGMQVADAAELMSSALAQFNLQGSDAGAVADALAAGAAAAQGSASDLGYALSQAGLVANSFGISMQETVGALSLFANTGMIGSDAGTSLKSMLQRLAGPSEEAANLMRELGINAYDASGNFIGLAGLAGQLQTAMGGLSMEQRNAAMSTIFGSDAVRAANALYEAGADGVKKWTDTVSQSGVASEMAAAKTDNLKGDLKQFSRAIENALIKTGSGANDALRGIVQTATGWVDAFASMDDSTQQFVVEAGLMVGAVAGLHKVFGDMQNSSSAFGRSMGLVLDPVQRLQVAFPQLSSGVQQVYAAMTTSARGADLMAGGMTRAQTATAGLKSIGTGVLNMFGGAWGVALTIAGVGLANYAKKVQEAKARTEELESAIESGANVSEKMVKQVQDVDYGWWDRMKSGVDDLSGALDKAGVSVSEFVLAAQGDTGALDKINGIIDKWSKYDSGSKEYNIARLMKGDLENLTKAYDDANAKADEAKQANQELAQANGQVGDSANGAASGTDQLTDALGESQQNAEDLSDALDDLVKNLFAIEEPTLNAAQATVSLDKSVRETVESLTQQGKVLDENGNYLDGMQEKGEEAKDSLLGLASQAQSTATKILEEGQATGNMEDATKRAGAALDQARDGFVKAAVAAGMSEEQAKKLADTYGLTSTKTDDLRRQIEALGGTTASPQVTADTNDANQKIDYTTLKLQSMPNGRFMVYGDNTQALQALADVTGAKIDDKTGTLTLDKTQYDVALALANGATINTKTGYLKGDNSDMFAKVAEANGWKIDKKTGYIIGNNGDALRSVKQVNDTKVGDKNFNVNALGATTAAQQIAHLQQLQIGDKSFTVKTYYTSQGEKVQGGTIPKFNATGGYLSGVGGPRADANLTWYSGGEYMVNAAATKRNRALLDAINYNGYVSPYPWPTHADGGLLTAATTVADYGGAQHARSYGTTYSQTNNFRMYTTGSPRTQADLIAAKVRFRSMGGTI